MNTDEEILQRKPIIDQRGRQKICAGLVNCSDIFMPEIGASLLRDPSTSSEIIKYNIANAEISMIEYLSGPFGEARYRKISTAACCLGGGLEDMSRTSEILVALSSDPEIQRLTSIEAEKRTSALIRSPKGWSSINEIACILQRKGVMSGAEVENICVNIYGAAVPHSAWTFCWPPTISQILSGYIPEQTS